MKLGLTVVVAYSCVMIYQVSEEWQPVGMIYNVWWVLSLLFSDTSPRTPFTPGSGFVFIIWFFV